MSGNLAGDPTVWAQAIPLLKENPERAQELLLSSGRRLDNLFQVIDKDTFTPVLRQNTLTVASTVQMVQGFRIGPWVSLNVAVRADASGTAGQILDLGMPPTLPMAPSNEFPCGIFWLEDQSATLQYSGAAFTTLSNPGYVRGKANATASYLGVSSFTAAVAINDRIGYSIQYLTTLDAI